MQAFPTLRMFKNGVAEPPDYRSDRTVDAFIHFVDEKLAMDHHVASLSHEDREAHMEMMQLQNNDHPGCLMAGFLLVNRVPGNFHIEARSNYHNLNPVMANLSHVVHQFSFGPTMNSRTMNIMEQVQS